MTKTNQITEQQFRNMLIEYFEDEHPHWRVETYEGAGVLTSDQGIIVRTDTGKFYLTIQEQ